MKQLAVVTSTRAEYGLLRPVLQCLQGNAEIQPHLLVTGTHLCAEYGNTVAEIEADALPIAARLDYMAMPASAGRAGTAQRTAQALQMFSEYFVSHRFDAVLLLGDRYEIFAVAQAAALLDIPVVHISGGDVTYGADDDWFRHCITKMAKLHFPSCEAYRQRLLRMGEQPAMVYNVGALGDENIRSLPLLTRAQLADSLQLPLDTPFALVTYHPETAASLSAQAQVEALLQAMQQHNELFYIITMANADAGGEVVNHAVQQYCQSHTNAALFASLGAVRYLSAMQQAALVLGNSSSGVVETPGFGTPTVDIGNRQKGRLTATNVLHCGPTASEISQAIAAVQEPQFVQKARQVHSPYNGGDTSAKIVQALQQHLLDGSLLKPKEFYDGGHNL